MPKAASQMRSIRWVNGPQRPRKRRQVKCQQQQQQQKQKQAGGGSSDRCLGRREDDSMTGSAAVLNSALGPCNGLRATHIEIGFPDTLGPYILTASEEVSSHDHIAAADYFRHNPGHVLQSHTPASTFEEQDLAPAETSPPEDQGCPDNRALVMADNDDSTVVEINPPSTALWNPNEAFYGEICSFLFQDSAETMAYTYFLRSVALIIPACDGTQNGYRQLASLALSSPVLMDTIVSISTLYMHLRGGAPMSVAVHRQSRALETLRNSLSSLTTTTSTTMTTTANSSDALALCEDTSSLKRDILATVLLQMTVEMANGGSEVRTHLRYAWHLFRELGYERAKPTSSIGTVLVQRMTFIDTLSSIFWQRRPFMPISLWFFTSRQDEHDEVCAPTFQETTGCPHWVISLLARISHLCADSVDGTISHTSLTAQAHELETDLNISARTYFPSSPPDKQQRPSRQRQHLEIVGRCFYWSALILLQRRVMHDPRTSSRVQSALTNLLQLMESLPIGCGPDSALSLSLYVAAHEAIDHDHRVRIRERSCLLTDEYPSKTREVMTAAFVDVWRDMDSAEDGGGDLLRRGQRRRGLGTAADLVKDRALFIC
ncbi:hypothetical protein AJ80_02780 [Polytolypa hystricis UAMH7299]|uniref:Transcription factor domain-containing protein n=1 Tax=Polytolypa hystricis (strain UAMH7299) TaxID=1447883 RepID=A0A2B7YQI6_POLH7|nr:hypothetical protein AJ80_02780 [Polytolypa hystricis UAMH7299]